MDKIEEVKKILIKNVANYTMGENQFPKEEMLMAVLPNLDEVAQQICQLFGTVKELTP